MSQENMRTGIGEKANGLIAATCRSDQCPQPVLQLVAAQELHPDFPPAKADIIFRVFPDLQAGQTTCNFSSLDRNSTSNSFLHF
ncbi:MAG: hypothetical protein Q7I89_06530 [Syntrophales bacterium]|nr:hypothetical protein [Syntrophales bacterium]